MGQLTFADLIARRVPLSAAEAAALTLAVARLMDAQRISGQRVRLPDDDWILLSSNGDVSIVEVHGSLECDETARLSALLRRLLQLDERLPAGRHAIVPGGLLIVLARNLGYIHLPATEPAAFRAALERFAAPDPSALSAVFWRAASSGREARDLRPVERRSRDARTRTERRHHGSSRADLRRALRDLERELYELRGRAAATTTGDRTARRVPKTTIAATLAASFLGALTIAALSVMGGERDPVGARRPDVALVPVATDRLRDSSAPRVVPVIAGLPDAGDEPVSLEPERPAPAATAVRLRRASTTADRPSRTEDVEPSRSGTPKKADPLAVHRGGTRGIAW